MGSNRLDYSGDVATSTADITTFMILIYRTLSTEDDTMIMMDIKNYYIGTLLPRFQYMNPEIQPRCLSRSYLGIH
jgi:hypothetical protein